MVGKLGRSKSLCLVAAHSFTLSSCPLHLTRVGIGNAIEKTLNGIEREGDLRVFMYHNSQTWFINTHKACY